MNDLVNRLSEKEHKITINAPDKSTEVLKECIGHKYVYILFEETGTELGLFLDEKESDYKQSDLSRKQGNIHLEGVATLNGNKVRCTVDADISTMKGSGRLRDEKEEDYKQVLS